MTAPGRYPRWPPGWCPHTWHILPGNQAPKWEDLRISDFPASLRSIGKRQHHSFVLFVAYSSFLGTVMVSVPWEPKEERKTNSEHIPRPSERLCDLEMMETLSLEPLFWDLYKIYNVTVPYNSSCKRILREKKLMVKGSLSSLHTSMKQGWKIRTEIVNSHEHNSVFASCSHYLHVCHQGSAPVPPAWSLF